MLEVWRELREVYLECLLKRDLRVGRLWRRIEGRCIWKLLKDSPRARSWAAYGFVSCSYWTCT